MVNIPAVTIDLENYPPTGPAGLTMRLRTSDREMVSEAAHRLGLRQADFIRMCVVNSAREINRMAKVFEGA